MPAFFKLCSTEPWGSVELKYFFQNFQENFFKKIQIKIRYWLMGGKKYLYCRKKICVY